MEFELFWDDLKDERKKDILESMNMTEVEFRKEMMEQFECDLECNAIATGMLPE